MPEPATTATITIAAASVTMPVLTAFGVPLGLRPDVLVAGFCGSLVAIALLNTVPTTGDTWREMVRTAIRRMCVALASSLTAGYLTPLVALIVNMPDNVLLPLAFAVGSSAQQALIMALSRISIKPTNQEGNHVDS
jgi:hypothetical protein